MRWAPWVRMRGRPCLLATCAVPIAISTSLPTPPPPARPARRPMRRAHQAEARKALAGMKVQVVRHPGGRPAGRSSTAKQREPVVCVCVGGGGGSAHDAGSSGDSRRRQAGSAGRAGRCARWHQQRRVLWTAPRPVHPTPPIIMMTPMPPLRCAMQGAPLCATSTWRTSPFPTGARSSLRTATARWPLGAGETRGCLFVGSGRGQGGRSGTRAPGRSPHASSPHVCPPPLPLRAYRYGLVGRNGTGKTTLLRHLGQRAIKGIPDNCQLLHVEQEVGLTSQSRRLRQVAGKV